MVQSKKDNNKLTPEDLRKFRALLIAKRNEILGDVSFMEDELIRKRGDASVARRTRPIWAPTPVIWTPLGLMASERRFCRRSKAPCGGLTRALTAFVSWVAK